jgi:hypothetical protein
MIVDIQDRASALINQLKAGLSQRRALNKMIGRRVQNAIRDYLIRLAGSRHDTANRLGANPSGHLAQAAEKVALPSNLTEIPEGILISLNHPGMGRAFHDVDIEPGPGKKYLTIPQVAQAYNQRAYRVSGLVFMRVGPAKQPVLAMPDKSSPGRMTVWYSLVPSVHQKQDRTLLPTDAEITAAALDGANDYVKLLLARKNANG